MWIIRYSCQILIKLEFIGQIFEKKTKHQISLQFAQWEPSCPCGRKYMCVLLSTYK